MGYALFLTVPLGMKGMPSVVREVGAGGLERPGGRSWGGDAVVVRFRSAFPEGRDRWLRSWRQGRS